MRYLPIVVVALISGCVVNPLPTGGLPPSGVPSASPSISPSAQPTPAPSQSPQHYESDGSKKGIFGPMHLLSGVRTFKGKQDGDGNFIVHLKPVGGDLSSSVFNEIGPGSWQRTVLIEKDGDFYIDVSLSTGAWSVSVE